MPNDLKVVYGQLKHVEYSYITKLFWKEYPYKVVCNMANWPRTSKVYSSKKSSTPRSYRSGSTRPSWNWQYNPRGSNLPENKKRKTRARAKFIKACPADQSLWKLTEVGYIRGVAEHHFSFYFKNEEDAARFINSCTRHVEQIHLPQTKDVLDVMLENNAIVLKRQPFWGQYEFCIHFRYHRVNNSVKDVEKWFKNVFDEGEALLKRNRIYLKDKSEFALVYLKMGGFVHKVEQAHIITSD